MTLPTEAVTLAGSGLVFVNDYSANVSDAYRSAIITAENFLQSHFTNQVTLGVSFDFAPTDAGSSAENQFSEVSVSYATYVAALRAHETTADDIAAVNNLPTTDPSNGAGFAIPTGLAEMLGLAKATNNVVDSVTLNSNLPFTFGQDAVGAVLHEMTEGAFGRIASLGFDGSRWNPLDLFRFTATGQRDFTGGSDGVATFFGVAPNEVSTIAYHNSVDAAGTFDGEDLGDWDHTRGDAFGPGGPGSPGTISATDLQVLDVIGWTPTSASGPFVPAPDDFANAISDAANHPFGQLTVGSSATGVLQQAGDHDLFAVQLQAGATYAISETGAAGRGGTLADPLLQLHDATGAVVATNDDIVDGTDPDSRITFTATTSGTYYVDAGAFVDGYAGSYTVGVSQTAGSVAPTGGGQALTAPAGGGVIQAPETNDTLTGGSGGPNMLRGNGGDDSIQGGAAFDDINGNKGNDTIDGGSGGSDWLVGGQGNDSITGHTGGNLLYGNLGDDTLHSGSGADVVRGGQGDDVIVAGSGDQFLSGDRGSDTITAGGGHDTLHGSQDAGIDRVLNFSASHDVVELDPGTTFTVSQVGADTVIDMGPIGGAPNQMILVGVSMSTLTGSSIFLG